MTEPFDDDLGAVDRAARAASRGLHDHVDRRIDPEVSLAALPPAPHSRPRGRLLAAAAVAALLMGTVAILGDGPGGEDRSRLEVDEDGNKLPAPVAGALTPVGPNDGRDSIQLPVTVEPNVDLHDGDTVTVSSSGFVPGEQVGIVQCAREAGGETREERAGIDGCTTTTVQYADADDQGVATGTFKVQRVLTTPATGTVDCALEAQRCIVAMGALTDYDRSGGFGVEFVPGGEPVDVPTLSATPDDGLADGDVVHVEGEGFEPNQLVTLNVCSLDPSGCWTTGEEVHLSGEAIRALGLEDQFGGGEYTHVGLVTDGDGRVSGDVPVWRFLPTTDPGTYIDCSVSRCTLRLAPERGPAPPPVPLAFATGGPTPRPPAVAVDPTEGLEQGDEVVVRGAGFEPGAYYSVSLCASPASDPASTFGCMSEEQDEIDQDGSFAVLFEIPDIVDFGQMTATTACGSEGACSEAASGGSGTTCGAPDVVCTIRVDTYTGAAVQPPLFPPAPVQVTFRK